MTHKILFVVFLFTLGCKSKSEDPAVNTLYEEVMQVHDEVMPETSTIHKLKKRLQNEMGSDSLTTIRIYELEQADEAMMSWMAEFGEYKSLAEEPDSVKLRYLKNELKEIQAIKTLMLSSIENAKKHIDENSK